MKSEIDFLNVSEITKIQQNKLVEQLIYLANNSPFYQNLFKEHQINIKEITSIEDLKQIPTTSKKDIQKHNASFYCVPNSEIIDISCTSGTLGNPVDFILTENDLKRLAYNEEMSFKCAGITKNSTVQLMTTIDHQFMAGMAYFLGLKNIGATVIRTGAGIPQVQWNAIMKYAPDFLVTVPSYLLKLIRYAELNKIDINKTNVKAAVCIGEPLRNQKHEPLSLTKEIQKKWNISLFSTYASTEMSTAFTECEHHIGGHERPDLIITEILDENGQPINKNEAVGELVVTTLGIEGMPLLRYKTGDLVTKYTEKCLCGRNTSRIGSVLGRKEQMIKFKGTTLYPPAISNVLNSFEEISGYVIEIHSNEVNNDEVNIKISSNGESNVIIDRLKGEMKARLRVVPSVELIEYSQLKKILHPSHSRKPKSIIDYRNQ